MSASVTDRPHQRERDEDEPLWLEALREDLQRHAAAPPPREPWWRRLRKRPAAPTPAERGRS